VCRAGKGRKRGVSARATSEGRRRKRRADEVESAESLLIGTRATDVGGRENHGKRACLPEKMGAKKSSYASAIIGDRFLPEVARRRRRHGVHLSKPRPRDPRELPGTVPVQRQENERANGCRGLVR